MRTVIFSDTHLSAHFEPKKFAFLAKIIQSADQVIINGDFWDSYLTSFEAFMTSQWQQLFPLLKAKKAIYIYGNHDPIQFADERVNLFSDQQLLEVELLAGGRRFLIEHGDSFDLLFQQWDKSWWGHLLFHLPGMLRFLMWGEWIVAKLINPYFSQKRFQRFNEEIKAKTREKLAPNEILVCGHTHSAEMDLAHQFVNHGVIRNGLGQYAVITDDGQIQLHEERY